MSYAAPWADYRRRLRLTWGVILGWMPASFAISALLDTARPAWLAFAWLGASMLCATWLNAWRCPRCARRFTGSLWGSGGRVTCAHCGLARYAEDAPLTDAPRDSD